MSEGGSFGVQQPRLSLSQLCANELLPGPDPCQDRQQFCLVGVGRNKFLPAHSSVC